MSRDRCIFLIKSRLLSGLSDWASVFMSFCGGCWKKKFLLFNAYFCKVFYTGLLMIIISQFQCSESEHWTGTTVLRDPDCPTLGSRRVPSEPVYCFCSSRGHIKAVSRPISPPHFAAPLWLWDAYWSLSVMPSSCSTTLISQCGRLSSPPLSPGSHISVSFS